MKHRAPLHVQEEVCKKNEHGKVSVGILEMVAVNSCVEWTVGVCSS